MQLDNRCVRVSFNLFIRLDYCVALPADMCLRASACEVNVYVRLRACARCFACGSGDVKLLSPVCQLTLDVVLLGGHMFLRWRLMLATGLDEDGV